MKNLQIWDKRLSARLQMFYLQCSFDSLWRETPEHILQFGSKVGKLLETIKLIIIWIPMKNMRTFIWCSSCVFLYRCCGIFCSKSIFPLYELNWLLCVTRLAFSMKTARKSWNCGETYKKKRPEVWHGVILVSRFMTFLRVNNQENHGFCLALLSFSYWKNKREFNYVLLCCNILLESWQT